MSSPDEVPETPEPEAAPLSRWERLGASLSGIILSGAGVAAVFVTSNQAGSVALLLVGVVLLIMAINGSPLTRARYQDYELFMNRRRRQIAATIEQESPADARQALRVLSAIDPRAIEDPAVARVSAHVYEREVVNCLARIYPETQHRGGAGDQGVDATVRTPEGLIGVQVKAGRGSLTGAAIRNIVQAAAYARESGHVPIRGLLVVTNMPFSRDHVGRRIRESGANLPTVVVRWLDEQDDDALKATLQELISRLKPSS